MKSKIIKITLAVLVLLISAFTHFYRIDQTYIFQNDEGRDALIAYKMIDTQRPILLGPETSVGNMYLGPFYYYLITPSLWLAGLDPVGPAAMIGLLGLLTTGLLIVLGNRHWGYTVGIIAGLFYALSPVMVHYSRSSWNPNAVPFFATLLLLLYPYRSHIAKVSFGLITGILFQLHYVALIMPGLLFLKDARSYWVTKKWSNFVKYCVAIMLGFFVSSAPFWLFEVRL
jgi:4-amino-4-deoxy-L-arabinose transferase and related glycosyltransferases of PMT family